MKLFSLIILKITFTKPLLLLYNSLAKATNEILGLKSIAEFQKKGFIKSFIENLKIAWYFETWYDKLILVGLGILGVWKIVEFF